MPVADIEKVIRKEPVETNYDIGSELGRGKFAIVKRCTEKSTGHHYASKVLKKRRRGKSAREEILVEIDIMRQAMDHPRIVKLHEVYESAHEFHIIIELATGGELFRVIAIDPLPEDKAREVVYQILDGVQHLHALNIVHLDLKPENILLYRKGSLDIKIVDFGLAIQLREGQEVKNLVGTAEYVAPEILSYDPLNTFSDMWSIGALTYALLTGYSPFQGETHQETFLNVSRCDYDFEDEMFDVVSQEAKEFIEKLLITAPKKRMTASKCLQHSWMKARKASTLNSSLSSLDSAVSGMDSASSMEPSPVSSASSSFSPAPSATTRSMGSTSTTTTSSYSQPEDMKKVNEKLSHISTLATERLVAAESAAIARQEGSPTSTDSSTSTLKADESAENIPALVKMNEAEEEASSSERKTAEVGKGFDSTDTRETRAKNATEESILERSLERSYAPTSRESALDRIERYATLPKNSRVERYSTLPRNAGLSKDSYSTLPRNAGLSKDSYSKLPRNAGLLKDNSNTLPRNAGLSKDSSNSLARGGGLSKDSSSSLAKGGGLLKDSSSTLPRDRNSSSMLPRDGGLSRDSSSALPRDHSAALDRSWSSNRTGRTERGGSVDVTSLDPKTIESLEKYKRLKQGRNRQKTPEPESPAVPEAKYLRSPERKSRRKSEGMLPISKRPDLKSFKSTEPALAEEEENQKQQEKERGTEIEKVATEDRKKQVQKEDTRAKEEIENRKGAARGRAKEEDPVRVKQEAKVEVRVTKPEEERMYETTEKEHLPKLADKPEVTPTLTEKPKGRRTPEFAKRFDRSESPTLTEKPKGRRTPEFSKRFERSEEVAPTLTEKSKGRRTPEFSKRFERSEEVAPALTEKSKGRRTPELSKRFERSESPKLSEKPIGRRTPEFAKRFETSEEESLKLVEKLKERKSPESAKKLTDTSPEPRRKEKSEPSRITEAKAAPEEAATERISSPVELRRSPGRHGSPRPRSRETSPFEMAVRMRQKSPVPDHLKQTKANRRKTPVISMDALDAILRGEIPDEELEELHENESTESSPQIPRRMLETFPEEEEPVESPTKTTSPERPRSPEKRVTINSQPSIITERGIESQRSTSPGKRERRVNLVSTITTTNTEYSPERRRRHRDHKEEKEEEDDFKVTEASFMRPEFSKSFENRGIRRLRAQSMVVLSRSNSTPDLSEIAGNWDNKDRKTVRVERAHSRRYRVRPTMDSNYVTSNNSTSYSSSSASSYTRRNTFSHRLLSGVGIGKSFSRSKDKPLRKISSNI